MEMSMGAYPPARPPRNWQAMPTPQARPAATETMRPRWSRAYSVRQDSFPLHSGTYSSARFRPQAVKPKVSAMKK